MNAARSWEPLTIVSGVEQKVDATPLRWDAPKQVTVISDPPAGCHWSDLGLAAMWGVMALCRDHTFQIVTRDMTRALAWWRDYMQSSPRERLLHALQHGTEPVDTGEHLFHWTDDRWPLPNVWVTVEVSTQADVTAQCHMLAAFPASVRGLRLTAMESQLDIENLLYVPVRCDDCGHTEAFYDTNPDGLPAIKNRDGTDLTCLMGVPVTGEPGDTRCRRCKSRLVAELAPIDWIIANYDGANHEWLRHLRDQAAEARVPFRLTSSQVSTPRLDGELHDGRPGDHA
jgi:protein gp37